jgi:Short C-terminal domain
MGLIGGMARTAVVAGTATAVSNRVSRRQANRWAAKDEQQMYEQEQAAKAQAYDQQQAYAAPPPQQYAPPPQQPAYAPQQPAAPAQDDMITQLQKLGELKAAGVLTEEEFAAQKAKILGS